MPAIRRKGDGIDVRGVSLEELLRLAGGDVKGAEGLLAGGDEPFAGGGESQGGNGGGMALKAAHDPAAFRPAVSFPA